MTEIDKIKVNINNESYLLVREDLMGLKLHYCQGHNFGDILSPYLLNKITNNAVYYVHPQMCQQHYIITGSIANRANKYSTIWGAGIANRTDKISPEATINALRGPISRSVAIECGCNTPLEYGDPALLLPYFCPQNKVSNYQLGIIPHYVDYKRIKELYFGQNDVLIIDINAGVESVARNINRCNYLLSSSLHGIIAAHAYDIPCLQIKVTDGIIGDGTKFLDYYLGADIVPYDPILINSPIKYKDIECEYRQDRQLGQDSKLRIVDMLKRSCPWEIKI